MMIHKTAKLTMRVAIERALPHLYLQVVVGAHIYKQAQLLMFAQPAYVSTWLVLRTQFTRLVYRSIIVSSYNT
jgi:hypothetical protein